MVTVSPGLQVDGIYRISGNLATIQKLRFVVDQGDPTPSAPFSRMFLHLSLHLRVFREVTLPYALCRPLEEPLNLDHSQWEDIHVVAGALKLFFRELPEPLFPSWIFQQLVEALS